MKHYYVTTPIYYANGYPHLGNTYTTTVADSLTRFYKYCGVETFFLTGMDEHGDKVAQAAEKNGKDPFTFTTEVANVFKDAWKELGFEYSRFIRTTDTDHKQVVRDLLQRIYDQGDIYFGEYGGHYCFGCERFLTEKELVDGKCPDHQVVPTFVKEQNYFFKMEKYRQRLLDHLAKNPDFIRPERYKNEVLAMLREPLEDLCISRPKTRLTWGIDLPFDDKYVTYVWFDALINYLTGIGYPNDPLFKDRWASCEHLTAKDIIKPHGVYWPIMLMAADIPLYKHLSVHGYWVTPTGKMSKSLGNVVDPLSIKREFGMDVFRYYVFREMTFGLDGTFNRETLELRYNADLANNLGNLISRSIAMCQKYRDGIVPAASASDELSTTLAAEAAEMIKNVCALIEGVEIHRALEKLWGFIDAVNVYIDRTKPWVLAKDGTAAGKEKLDTVLYSQLEAIRVIASLLTAFMPDTSQKILTSLGFTGKNLTEQQKLSAIKTWGGLKAGQKLVVAPSLFPRLEITEKSKTSETKPMTEETKTPEITFDDFAKVDLRVGQIMAAEKIEKSDKLLKLQVSLGEALGMRQIVAGIAKRYQAEELVGRKILVVSNLKPAKLMGTESQGMLLAASDEAGNLEIIAPDPIMPPGSRVK